MDYPEDPWNTPDVHKNHNHGPEPPRSNGSDVPGTAPVENGSGLFSTSPQTTMPGRTTSTFTTSAPPSASGPVGESAGTWGFFDGNPSSAGGFSSQGAIPTVPFAVNEGAREPAIVQPVGPTPSRTIGGGRAGSAVEENILVTLMPEKEGMFLFQHHNYEVSSTRRTSKVIRRYSDFVWLLDCLHKRYPFRVLPLLPPKRVAGANTVIIL